MEKTDTVPVLEDGSHNLLCRLLLTVVNGRSRSTLETWLVLSSDTSTLQRGVFIPTNAAGEL